MQVTNFDIFLEKIYKYALKACFLSTVIHLSAEIIELVGWVYLHCHGDSR